ncbi:nucleotidyltransferase [Deinococcus aetherius]|uniref:Nucleotidyltransferase n=1 Tax=Deinococcus aetherius TaxID=200252 RepID=A0ABN6RIN2_9DEIO|nr:nucleotidyltransferase domain-containing protein [Deinococcus aetherius]BDP43225.1 nucleotidyltransferase [Deinococcus aetherius]
MTLPPVLPVGTSVVIRLPVAGHPAGAVAVIVRSPPDPGHAYRVRFPDGTEATLSRGGLTVRRHEKNALPGAERDFTPFVQLRCVVGSRAFGLETAASDTDLRGFYLPPARDHWSLAGVPEQLEFGEEVYWETGKFVLLALKANPNVLEVLHSPLVQTVTPLAAELLSVREAFLSRLVYQTYNGYVMGQFGRLEADLRQHGEVRWKHAMHLLRLLLSGIAVLERGEVQVHVGEHRETLLAVKRGEAPWAEVERWRLSLHADFDRAYAGTTLPERPDYARVEAWLLRARRAALDW